MMGGPPGTRFDMPGFLNKNDWRNMIHPPPTSLFLCIQAIHQVGHWVHIKHKWTNLIIGPGFEQGGPTRWYIYTALLWISSLSVCDGHALKNVARLYRRWHINNKKLLDGIKEEESYRKPTDEKVILSQQPWVVGLGSSLTKTNGERGPRTNLLAQESIFLKIKKFQCQAKWRG